MPPDWNLVKDYYCCIPGFKLLRESLLNQIHYHDTKLDESMLTGFIQSNPEYFQVYYLVGEYYFLQKDYGKALSLFNIALKKQIPFTSEKQTITSRIEFCLQKIKTRIE